MRTHVAQSSSTESSQRGHEAPASRLARVPLFTESVAEGSSVLQRKAQCACGGGCPRCQGKAAESEAKQNIESVEHATNRENILAKLGPGEPLDAPTRSLFEGPFAQDFSGVRVHTGPEAAESARAVDALAFTIGPHIAFASGHYDRGNYWRALSPCS